MSIRFNSRVGEYEELSNFYLVQIDMGGTTWPSVEHYYQAMKFRKISQQEAIRECSTSEKAKRLAKTLPIRDDWEKIKDDVMYDALWKKFSNAHCKEVLLSTGEEELIEYAPWDSGDGTGQNKLGKILMQIREELAEREMLTCSK
jgi:hypothetical protein